MSAYWQLTLAQLRLFVRNRQVLFWTLAFPIFFMLMFGAFIGKDNAQQATGILINQDDTPASQVMAQALQQQPVVKFKQSADLIGAETSLKNGDNQFIVVIPKGYMQSLQKAGVQNAAAHIRIYYDQTSVTKVQIGEIAISQVIDDVSKKTEHYHPLVQPDYIGMQGLHLRYIDFIVPGILAMMIMNNNLNGVAGQIASWRERAVLRRMQSTPLKASTFIGAQITARLLLNVIQVMIVILVGFLVFGTQVNGSWLLLFAFVILGTLAFMSIGFIIAGLAKTPESAGPIAGFISFPLLFLGGIFFPIQSMPPVVQYIVKTLPITQLSTALRQLMNIGAGLPTLWPQMLFLLAWAIAAFIVASFTFRWE